MNARPETIKPKHHTQAETEHVCNNVNRTIQDMHKACKEITEDDSYSPEMFQTIRELEEKRRQEKEFRKMMDKQYNLRSDEITTI